MIKILVQDLFYVMALYLSNEIQYFDNMLCSVLYLSQQIFQICGDHNVQFLTFFFINF